MERRLKKFLKRYWTIVWAVIAFVTLVIIAAFAAYTKTNRAKNVVARYGEVDTRFSSNYLEETEREKPIYVTENDGMYGDNVFICNYAQTNPTYHYDTLINYTLKFNLGYMSGSNFVEITPSTSLSVFDIDKRYITVTVNGNNGYTNSFKMGYDSESDTIVNYTYSIEKSGDDYYLYLPGTTSLVDTINLQFSSDQKDDLFEETPTYSKKLYVEVIATPDPPENYAGISPIKAYICLSKSGKVEPITWTGNFNETGADMANEELEEHPLTNYLDGYNYVIQGMGAGTAQLTWNSDYLLISEQFLIDELGYEISELPVQNGGQKSITIELDSTTKKNRYDIQFYQSGNKEESDYDTWEEITSYVNFTFPYTAP